MIKEYYRWLESVEDTELRSELLKMKEDTALLEDAFFRELSFGTGGLRGKLGAGTNRMNIYTVKRASLGLAKYLLGCGGESIAIGYDTRIKSKEFAEIAAALFASLKIKVFIYPEPLPTPMLSFAVRELKASAGVMITASHNPSQYNGYKVYGADGCQITEEAAKEILCEIKALDYFEYCGELSFGEGCALGKIEYIGEDIYESFLKRVSEHSVLYGAASDKSLRIVYTALNGTGARPVCDILKSNGYENLITVNEQMMPDGYFPTCKKPNPELSEALTLGLSYLKEKDADILIATDPDCDRIGAVVKGGDGFVHLNGNEIGLLLLYYILTRKKAAKKLKEGSVCLKTIVTSPLAEKVADSFGVKTISLLTGFKYIGETIGLLEKEGQVDDFIFGFEESCGYLGGSYVRDKDGVYGAFILSEMAAYYKALGKTLTDILDGIYKEYGYFKSRLVSFDFEGEIGAKKIADIMKNIRGTVKSYQGITIKEKKDYLDGLCGLPKSNVLELILSDGDRILVRPSGTEPKIKFYVFVTGDDEKLANKKLDALSDVSELIR